MQLLAFPLGIHNSMHKITCLFTLRVVGDGYQSDEDLCGWLTALSPVMTTLGTRIQAECFKMAAQPAANASYRLERVFVIADKELWSKVSDNLQSTVALLLFCKTEMIFSVYFNFYINNPAGFCTVSKNNSGTSCLAP